MMEGLPWDGLRFPEKSEAHPPSWGCREVGGLQRGLRMTAGRKAGRSRAGEKHAWGHWAEGLLFCHVFLVVPVDTEELQE